MDGSGRMCEGERNWSLAVGQKKLSQCSDRLAGIKVAVVARSPLDRPCFANSRALLSDRMIASEAFFYDNTCKVDTSCKGRCANCLRVGIDTTPVSMIFPGGEK